MATAHAWYFAYGSNMSRAQMRSRAGTVLSEQPARLENYELIFNKKARGGTGAANIRLAPGRVVHGVLYQIPEAAFRSLDRFENAPEHYRRIEVTVTDSAGKKVPAQVYIATRVETGLRPATHYLKTILDGAGEHGLPEEYIGVVKAAAGAA
ncbi:MAG TPA: gamma-glutamylcyclotransferase family protein [Candidatus Acidoferrales bacterium]|nr:gamma-glutamylcyclotransferase family protein [Candidatus Acidoferrales bacterium]